MKTEQFAYVSLLSTDSYLPGIIALHQSLRRTNSRYEFIVVASQTISSGVLQELERLGVSYLVYPTIPNPFIDNDRHPYYTVFDKLHVFGMSEYSKLVFLDADTLVMNNIDDLFTRPGWSAVNAGGFLPQFSHWVQFNSGVMVVEPDKSLFNRMQESLVKLGASDCSDQGFLHNFFPEWPIRTDLHISHAYNVPINFLNHYVAIYSKPAPETGRTKAGSPAVNVLHFWADRKPWLLNSPAAGASGYERDAYRYWWECYTGHLITVPAAI